MKIIYIKIVFQVKEQLKFLNQVFRQKCFSKKSRKKKTDNPKFKFVTDIIDIQNNDSDKETNFNFSVKQNKKELTDDDDEGIIFSSCNNDVE